MPWPLSSSPQRPDIAALQRQRFVEAVSYAREHSPYYRELYQDLPETVTNVTELPVTDKTKLMPRFDDWATDRQITRVAVDEFRSDPSLVGTPFLGKYMLSVTSGTTGFPGVFVLSREELEAISNLRNQQSVLPQALHFLTSRAPLRMLRGRGRYLSFATMGGHYLVSAMWKFQNPTGQIDPSRKILPSDLPVRDMVKELNEFQPAVLFGFAGTIAILASEQERGRLAIRPAMIVMSGEGLTDEEYARIEKVFGALLMNQYACNEAPLLSNSCRFGWHHVTDDQVIFEPVNGDYSPTPVGQFSDTVLLSVLYRRVQPILRYDLGDQAMQRPDPCECGSPYPAFKIRGRTLDMLHSPDGQPAASLSGVFSKFRNRVPGYVMMQFASSGGFDLRLRLQLQDDAPVEQTWTAALIAIKEIFEEFDLGHYSIERDNAPVMRTKGGKYPKLVREG